MEGEGRWVPVNNVGGATVVYSVTCDLTLKYPDGGGWPGMHQEYNLTKTSEISTYCSGVCVCVY